MEHNELPKFAELLKNPTNEEDLPSDFDVETEAKHLEDLWQKNRAKLSRYHFVDFIHAGGAGMVFKVKGGDMPQALAMKLARSKLVSQSSDDVAKALSPVSESELRALKRLSHPNLVSLSDAIEDKRGIVGIVTSLVEEPRNIHDYIGEVLPKPPPESSPLDPRRIDRACEYVLERFKEIASVLKHMHHNGVYHFDVKPANILVSKTKKDVFLTDLGACVITDELDLSIRHRVYFTWTYAHSELVDLVHDIRGISGGGLHSSAEVDLSVRPERFDLFSLGKTIQEVLAVIELEFRARSHASYPFRFLHLVACLLLDGNNVPGASYEKWYEAIKQDGRTFASNCAMNYPAKLFVKHKILSAGDLCERLDRFANGIPWQDSLPELSPWCPEGLNSVIHSPAPFTRRVSKTVNHPIFQRLKRVKHLGWMDEVYPGATHNRWTHSIGSFSAVVSYIGALLLDPEVPTFRLLASEDDIRHTLVAALIHDLGQTPFGHDLEEVAPFLYDHSETVERLLHDKRWAKPTLAENIKAEWDVDIDRILCILRNGRKSGRLSPKHEEDLHTSAVDGVATDCIDGPMDADKLDYLIRDSVACGVPYGHGIDATRLLKSLTVTARLDPNYGARLSLAYKAKGRPAVVSLLLARYQMYGSVYWHHTYRCIQTMFSRVAADTFHGLDISSRELNGIMLYKSRLKTLFYDRVIFGIPWNKCSELTKYKANKMNAVFNCSIPSSVDHEPVLEFIWRFADVGSRKLLEDLGERRLYKRAFELRLGELGDRADYSAISAHFTHRERTNTARNFQDNLLNTIDDQMRKHGSTDTAAEHEARLILSQWRSYSGPLFLIDFPSRGVPGPDVDFPLEIVDAVRKYFVMSGREEASEDNFFHSVRTLQQKTAAIRVFCQPDFHNVVARYLTPSTIQNCLSEVISSVPPSR